MNILQKLLSHRPLVPAAFTNRLVEANATVQNTPYTVSA